MNIVSGLVRILLCIVLITSCSDPGGGEADTGGGETGPHSSSNPIHTPVPDELPSEAPDFRESGVTDLKASQYEYAGAITLKWTSIKGVERYKIYRYDARNDNTLLAGILEYEDTAPDVIDEISIQDQFIDDTGDYNKPLFYRIACTIDGEDGEKSGFVYGICAQQPDVNEPENDFQSSEDAGSTVFNPADPYLMMYALSDGNGSVVTDVDWYKIRCGRESFSLTIQPDPAGTVNISEGDIQLEFYYKGVKKAAYDVKPFISSYPFGGYPSDYNNEADTGEAVDVNYRLVFVNTNVNQKKIFKYKIIK